MLKVYYRWIKSNTSKDILDYHYSVDNETWLCDKARVFQS